MRRSSGSGRRTQIAAALWLLLVAAGAVLAVRAHYSADLSAFLPSSPTDTQRLLVNELREGFASRLILGQISGADGPRRAAVSLAMAALLARDTRFTDVSCGAAAQTQADQRFLMQHRYLLSDAVTPERFTAAGLRGAVEDTLDLLTSPEGLLAKNLLTRDPTGEMVLIASELARGNSPHTVSGVWSSRDGEHALLIAQTRAQGSDTDAQERSIAALEKSFAAAVKALPQASGEPLKLKLTGTPVFQVQARERIRSQAIRLSLVSATLVVMLLLGVYRSLPALGLGLVAILSAALTGIAAVSQVFGTVHGVTLGFGVTLIGEVVDYSIYLVIQARSREFRARWLVWVWPTIWLGMLTSVAGFASLLPSGFPGLMQLGVYSIAGLVAGAAVTRFLLPAWLPERPQGRDLVPVGAQLARLLPRLQRARPWLLLVPLAAGALLYTHWGTLLDRDIAALSPVSQADIALDERIQDDLGVAASGSLVVLNAPDREGVLRAAEAAGMRLTPLVNDGVLGGVGSPAAYLPSQSTQTARRASLPEAGELRERLTQALTGMPLSASRLEPFIADVERARQSPLITADDLAGTSFAAAVEALLFASGGHWHALLPLTSPQNSSAATAAIDIAAVKRALADAPGAPQVLQVRTETNALYDTYLHRAVRYCLIGLGAIIVLLLGALREPTRVLRVVAPLLLSVLTVASVFAATGRQLTIVHVMGMLLIVAVGSNYALFFERRAALEEPAAEPVDRAQALMLASLLVANLATVMSFGVLAFSSVPVLAALGQTVAPGTALSLLFAAVLSRSLAAPAAAPARTLAACPDPPPAAP